MSHRQKIWNGAIQRRIGMTSTMLSSMKNVKMMGLSEIMGLKIQEQRTHELKKATGYRWTVLGTNVACKLDGILASAILRLTRHCIAYCPSYFSPVLIFIAFVIQARASGSGSLNTNTAFTSLSIITLVTQPAAQLIAAIPNTIACLGCFERIQKYLLTANRIDQRKILDSSDRSDHSSFNSISKDGIALLDIPNQNGTPSFTKSLVAVSLNELSVRPAPNADVAIHNVSVDFNFDTFNVVTGPVGSGKTTMIRAIMGELPFESGNVTVSSVAISYCPPTPWIINATIKQSICGLDEENAKDEEWYHNVLHACALDEDIMQFPQGDESIVGNRGLTLSGGQRQRLASSPISNVIACNTT